MPTQFLTLELFTNISLSSRAPEESCQQVIKEVIICISGNLKHDHHFAVDCEGSAIHFVEENRKLKFNKISKFSDGAPSTYKSRYSYFLASEHKRIEKNICEAHHGKNLADGDGAVAKHMLDTGIKMGKCS